MANAMTGAIVPAGPPPPGVTSNFVDPPYIGNRLVVVCVVFMPLSIIATVTRLWTRVRITKAFGIDDCALILATTLAAAEAIVMIMHTRNGLGYHMWDIPLTTFTPGWTLWNFISVVVYSCAMWFVKLTVLLLYLRLFPDKWTRIGVFVMLFITASQFVANEVAIFASCKPLAKLWDLSITDGKCNDQNKQNLGSGYMNVFTDVLIFLLPLPRVYLLKLPQRQKAALMGVFALGAFVCAVSIVRLVEVYPLLKDPDPSWKVVSPLIWSILELDVGIICACLVVYRPFLRRYAPPFLAWSEKTMYTASTGPSKESASKNKQQRCRRNDSYILSSKSDGVSEPEPLELGDGPKAEVSIYAQGAIDRSRKPSVGAPPHSDDRDESTDYILKDGSEQHDPAHDNAIMKSTQVQVKRTDKN